MMTFKDAYKDDLGNAFFDVEEFAEIHTIDGEEYAAVLIEMKNENAKMSYGSTRSTLNPKETAIGRVKYVIYFREEDARRKFMQNAVVNLDGKKFFIHDIQRQNGVYRMEIGINAV